MEWQTLINIGGAGLLASFGWFARQIWDSVQELKKDVQKIEIDLPTNYVRKVDIESRFDKLEAILARIFDKIEQKADK